jgi:hypothetical protein
MIISDSYDDRSGTVTCTERKGTRKLGRIDCDGRGYQGLLAQLDGGMIMKNDKPRWSYIIQVLVVSVLLAAVPFWIQGVSLQYASLVAVVILWTAAALVGLHLWKSKRDKREP